eukprot:TRINITY_DN121133_c0_g1_i1.p1 TRINITY_DN121133_c0_g1~~TRINITY_DN121133_c0_g1_i1.p1  ORF type:complete len:584 (-),score=93.99 TRINITY_DN121133_c0_g1_i1:120-1871(-)
MVSPTWRSSIQFGTDEPQFRAASSSSGPQSPRRLWGERSISVTISPRQASSAAMSPRCDPPANFRYKLEPRAAPLGPKDTSSSRFRDRHPKSEVFSDKGRRHYSPRDDPMSPWPSTSSAAGAVSSRATSPGFRRTRSAAGFTSDQVHTPGAAPFAGLSSARTPSRARFEETPGRAREASTERPVGWLENLAMRQTQQEVRARTPSISRDASQQQLWNSSPRMRTLLHEGDADAAEAHEVLGATAGCQLRLRHKSPAEAERARCLSSERGAGQCLNQRPKDAADTQDSELQRSSSRYLEHARALLSGGPLDQGLKRDDFEASHREEMRSATGSRARPTVLGHQHLAPVLQAIPASPATAPTSLINAQLAQLARNCLHSLDLKHPGDDCGRNKPLQRRRAESRDASAERAAYLAARITASSSSRCKLSSTSLEERIQELGDVSLGVGAPAKASFAAGRKDAEAPSARARFASYRQGERSTSACRGSKWRQLSSRSPEAISMQAAPFARSWQAAVVDDRPGAAPPKASFSAAQLPSRLCNDAPLAVPRMPAVTAWPPAKARAAQSADRAACISRPRSPSQTRLGGA